MLAVKAGITCHSGSCLRCMRRVLAVVILVFMNCAGPACPAHHHQGLAFSLLMHSIHHTGLTSRLVQPVKWEVKDGVPADAQRLSCSKSATLWQTAENPNAEGGEAGEH
eukprot:2244830-Rhodomonas_salina.1